MQGTLADLDLADLAVVTSLGRTSLRLEVTDPAGMPVGQLVLKAGHVVSATGRGVRGRDALRLIMTSAANSRFRLVREPLDYRLSSALAMVDELAGLARPRLAHSSAQQIALATPRTAAGTAAPAPRVRMLEGRVDEFELATVIQTIGMGRTCVELDVRDAADRVLGTVRIKAGKIVSARANDVEGIAAFSALMRSPECHYFVAFRVDEAPDQLSALGSVAQLVLGALDAPPAAPRETVAAEKTSPAAIAEAATAAAPDRDDRIDRPAVPELTPVMEGSLEDFALRTLLETFALTRQSLHLHILDRDHAPLGELQLKSGMIVTAFASARGGTEALGFLLGVASSCRFRVLAGSPDLRATPLGSIHQLLATVTATGGRRGSGRAARVARITIPTLVVLGGVIAFVVLRPAATPPPPAAREPVVLLPATPAAPPAASTVRAASSASSSAHEAPVAHDGPAAPETATARAAGAAPHAAHAPPPARVPPRASVETAQAMLKHLGFDPGPIDNVYGEHTRRALLRFQRRYALSETGVIDDDTWRTIVGQLSGN